MHMTVLFASPRAAHSNTRALLVPFLETWRTMNSRPKDPKTARNKNVLVIGGSGSGKTRFWLKPNLMQMHSSYVVTDPNGNLQ